MRAITYSFGGIVWIRHCGRVCGSGPLSATEPARLGWPPGPFWSNSSAPVHPCCVSAVVDAHDTNSHATGATSILSCHSIPIFGRDL